VSSFSSCLLSIPFLKSILLGALALGGVLLLEICLLGSIFGVRDGNLAVVVLGLPLSFPFLTATDSASVASKVTRVVGAASLCWWDEVVGLQAAIHFQR
jgi:hypothetical protein